MKLMIVDDNAAIRRLVRELLSDVAKEFVECADGEEAVAEFPRVRPDWVVMDVMMKVMDGLTATRRIVAAFPEARIVVVSHDVDPKLSEMAVEAGAAQFLSKEDLLELRRVCR